MNPNNENERYTAIVKRTLPFNAMVWIIPILALLTGVWLLFQHIRHTGPEVTLYMKDAEGIEVNTTVIKVLNVAVGKVTAIKISPDQKGVKIKAQLTADVKNMMRQDTQFWIVKPRIDQSGITGLNTLVSGSYIAFTPGHSKTFSDSFKVNDLPPASAIGQTGIRLTLKGHSDKLLSPGSPLLYGDISAGQVEKAYFEPKDNSVHYQIYVNSPYDSLIGSNVKFWLQSGVQVTATGSGIHIDSAPLPALISGAIAFKTTEQGKGSAIDSNYVFTLYNSQQELDSQPSSRAQYYVTFFKQSIRGLTAGAPVEYHGIKIGSVADVPYFSPNDSHQLFNHGWVPVRLRLEPASMEINASPQSDQIWRQQIQQALNHGLTASLENNNIVTGNQYVSLTEVAATTPKFKPMNNYQTYAVIASRSSGIDAIQHQLSDFLAKLNALPLNQSVNEINSTLAELKATLRNVNKLMAQDNTQQLPAEISSTLQQLQQTLQGIGPNSPMYQQIQHTLQSIDQTLKTAQPTLQTLKQQPNALIFNRHDHDPVPQGAHP